MAQNLNAPVYDALAVSGLLRVTFTPESLETFGAPPPPLPGYLTFFDPGWSILYLRLTVKKEKPPAFADNGWYVKEPFADGSAQSRYRQVMMMRTHTGFTRKTYADQLRLLGPDEEVPSARVVVMGTVLHFLASGQRLFHDCWVRTADTPTGGARVVVGYFDHHGLHVDDVWDGYRLSYIGLAVVRKFT